MNGPGCGRDVDRVVRLPLMLVGGKKPQCSECPWVILARMGGREGEARQADLGMRRLLWGTSSIGLIVRELWGAGGLG